MDVHRILPVRTGSWSRRLSARADQGKRSEPCHGNRSVIGGTADQITLDEIEWIAI
jgi:hypothetical protein